MTQPDAVEEMSLLFKVRLQEWRLREMDSGYRPKPVITITREPGCGGESVAQMISVESGLHLYDWELIEQIAKDEDTYCDVGARFSPFHWAGRAMLMDEVAFL